MKTNPEQPDPTTEVPSNPTTDAPTDALTDALEAQIDALLAEEAKAQPVPAELEDKVIALTDPQLLALMDEALAPDEAPAQLVEKIITATQSATQPDTHRQAPIEQPAVIARIGSSNWRYAAAAAIVLAAGAGLWWAGTHSTAPDNEITDNRDEPRTIAQLIEDIHNTDNQPLFETATDAIEANLQAVADRMDGYAIDRETIWSDMDDYEQFLADFEDTDRTTPAT